MFIKNLKSKANHMIFLCMVVLIFSFSCGKKENNERSRKVENRETKEKFAGTKKRKINPKEKKAGLLAARRRNMEEETWPQKNVLPVKRAVSDKSSVNWPQRKSEIINQTREKFNNLINRLNKEIIHRRDWHHLQSEYLNDLENIINAAESEVLIQERKNEIRTALETIKDLKEKQIKNIIQREKTSLQGEQDESHPIAHEIHNIFNKAKDATEFISNKLDETERQVKSKMKVATSHSNINEILEHAKNTIVNEANKITHSKFPGMNLRNVCDKMKTNAINRIKDIADHHKSIPHESFNTQQEATSSLKAVLSILEKKAKEEIEVAHSNIQINNIIKETEKQMNHEAYIRQIKWNHTEWSDKWGKMRDRAVKRVKDLANHHKGKSHEEFNTPKEATSTLRATLSKLEEEAKNKIEGAHTQVKINHIKEEIKKEMDHETYIRQIKWNHTEWSENWGKMRDRAVKRMNDIANHHKDQPHEEFKTQQEATSTLRINLHKLVEEAENEIKEAHTQAKINHIKEEIKKEMDHEAYIRQIKWNHTEWSNKWGKMRDEAFNKINDFINQHHSGKFQ